MPPFNNFNANLQANVARAFAPVSNILSTQIGSEASQLEDARRAQRERERLQFQDQLVRGRTDQQEKLLRERQQEQFDREVRSEALAVGLPIEDVRDADPLALQERITTRREQQLEDKNRKALEKDADALGLDHSRFTTPELRRELALAKEDQFKERLATQSKVPLQVQSQFQNQRFTENRDKIAEQIGAIQAQRNQVVQNFRQQANQPVSIDENQVNQLAAQDPIVGLSPEQRQLLISGQRDVLMDRLNESKRSALSRALQTAREQVVQAEHARRQQELNLELGLVVQPQLEQLAKRESALQRSFGPQTLFEFGPGATGGATQGAQAQQAPGTTPQAGVPQAGTQPGAAGLPLPEPEPQPDPNRDLVNAQLSPLAAGFPTPPVETLAESEGFETEARFTPRGLSDPVTRQIRLPNETSTPLVGLPEVQQNINPIQTKMFNELPDTVTQKDFNRVLQSMSQDQRDAAIEASWNALAFKLGIEPQQVGSSRAIKSPGEIVKERLAAGDESIKRRVEQLSDQEQSEIWKSGLIQASVTPVRQRPAFPGETLRNALGLPPLNIPTSGPGRQPPQFTVPTFRPRQ